MTDKKTEEQEPSIEDILESIRQIISDEDEEKIEDGGELKTEEEQKDSTGDLELKAEEESQDKAGDVELPKEEDDYTPADIEGDMTEENTKTEEVLVLSDVVEDVDGGELETEEEPQDKAGDVELPKEEDDYTPADIEGDMTEDVQNIADIVMEEIEDEEDNNSLMSDVTEEAAIDSFAKLADNVYVEDERTSEFVTPPGRVTLEQITRELMRPMIKEWLDSNLPDLVENLVKKEIEKLSDKAKK